MSTIIGIDHGNGLIKTAHDQFSTGVAEYDEAPPIETPYMVRLGKKYYVCDSGRGPLKIDKTKDQTYWYLTLAGIGTELKKRKIASPPQNPEEIIIAAGLPLTYPKEDRDALENYLKRGEVDYWFGGRRHKIIIKKAIAFPQGYSALMNVIHDYTNEPLINVIDIGSWTVDAISVGKAGKPNMDKARSLEYGVIQCMEEIIEQVRRKTKKSITQEQIEAVLWSNKPVIMPPDIKNEIYAQTGKYVGQLINKLQENGFDTASVPAIFVGGGAGLVKKFNKKSNFFYPIFMNDIKSNAIGYEIMAAAAIKRNKR